MNCEVLLNFATEMNATETQPRYIALAGLIGAGKTTLAAALAENLNAMYYKENVIKNPYLEKFYTDMPKYAFPLQVHLLNERFKQQQHIVWSGKGGVQDRSIYEDKVFAKMLTDQGILDPLDYETYCSLFANMSKFMQKPNVIVFLDVTPEVSLQRIQTRGRECESGVTLDYLRALHSSYQSFIQDISKTIPVVRVKWDTFANVEEVVVKIEEAYAHATNIQDVNI